MASEDDVHPVDTTWLIPRSSCSIETSLESIPTNVATMLYGLTRRAPWR